MEKLKLIIERDRIINIDNPFGEKSTDYLSANTYMFERGNIYGIICEHGGGGEAISLLLSNTIPLEKAKIYIDDIEARASDIEKNAWYVGKTLYAGSIIKKEMSVKQALNGAVKEYHRYNNIDDIVEEFHLTVDRLDYGLTKKWEWEMWRASIAIGYASNKKIYCFPWMNTLYFYDCMYNSSVFRFFKKLKEDGAIIILPTSRKENVSGFADNIIEICNPRFEHIISDSQYFKQYF